MKTLQQCRTITLGCYESDGDYFIDALNLKEMDELQEQPLYAQQESLPDLPVPTLEETMELFLPSAIPLAENSHELETLREACHVFPQQAHFLQERLLDRAKSFTGFTSWLQNWWNTQVYLQSRDPLIHSSYFFNLGRHPKITDPYERAAAVLHATAEYAQRILKATKLPDMDNKQQHYLCSSQYKYLFQTTRLPGKDQDTNAIYTPPHGLFLKFPYRSFAIVAVNGQFYNLRLTNPYDHSIFSMEKIKDALVHRCKDQNAPRLGYCTTQARDVWCHDYEQIISMPRLNEHESAKHPFYPVIQMETMRTKDEPLLPLTMNEALDMLQSALVVLCLDLDMDTTNDPRKLVNHLFHGHGTANRWFDKSIQLVVTADASLGIIGEHSMADGGTAAGFAHYIHKQSYRETDFPEVDEVYIDDPKLLYQKRMNVLPKPVFEYAMLELSEENRSKVEQHVASAETSYIEMIEKFDVQWLEYTKYGNAVIKTCGCSPDAFVQMTMQLAAYRYFGTPVATYESAQTRKFRHGRTETIRTVCPDSYAFCNAMEEQSVESLTLLRRACHNHTKYARKAVNGKGVDRHFLGLKNCCKEGEPLPDLFQHPVFLRSKRWRLSTSNVPNMAPGFAYTEEDGFGIGYDIRKDRIIFTITCNKLKNDADEFSSKISTALDDMYDMVKEHLKFECLG